jgi:hypothetical protein
MLNYNRCNGNKRFYIGGSVVKSVRVKRYAAGCGDSGCVGLFDFVMSHYAYDVTRLRLNQRWKLIEGEMVFDDEAAYYM